MYDDLIRRGTLIKNVNMWIPTKEERKQLTGCELEFIDNVVTSLMIEIEEAEIVPVQKYIEQLKWERDMALEQVKQLNDTGVYIAKWIYWEGWIGNHDQRIDDATCSRCGYKHQTVRWQSGDERNSTPDKLSNYCPCCGAKMIKRDGDK